MGHNIKDSHDKKTNSFLKSSQLQLSIFKNNRHSLVWHWKWDIVFIVNHLMIEGRIIGVAVAATIITENECILFEVQPPCKVVL